MKRLLILIFPVILLALFLLVKNNRDTRIIDNNQIAEGKVSENKKANMKISSPVFENNKKIPGKYTCDGQDNNPPLEISGVPQNAKSLVLIVDDPDAPSKTWVHWVVFNIDPKIDKIAESSVPKGGVLGMTDFGRLGYGGPCPPSGTHRYFFKLYALDTVLNLEGQVTKDMLLEEMKSHIIDSAELIGLYSRT